MFDGMSESGLLSDVAYIMCLDSIGSGSELFVHVSKPPKNDSVVDFLLKVCRHCCWFICYVGGFCMIDRALIGPWKSLNFFPDFQGLESPWKQTWSLNLCLKVLESAWIWFSKTPWPNQLILKKVFQMVSFWPPMYIKSIFGQGFAPDPSGWAYDAYICL